MKTTKSLSSILLNYASSDRERQVVETRIREADSNRAVSRLLGVPRRTVDRIINRVMKRAEEEGETSFVNNPQVLFLDIETGPSLTYLWSLWDAPRNTKMQETPTVVLSWAAKWADEDEVMSASAAGGKTKNMLAGIHALLCEADFVVAHNGDKFDIKHLNTQFLLYGFPPPTPYRQVDTLKILKRRFRFDSNRLDYVCEQLFGETKSDSGGFDTWRGCMQGDPEAWATLIKYNRDDVLLLERLYNAVRAWDHLHPNVAVIMGDGEDGMRCTVCGSANISPTDKPVRTPSLEYKGWQCNDCGHHMRERNSALTPAQRKSTMVNAR